MAEHATTIPVLGIPVRFVTDDPAVLDVAERAFGAWRALASTPDLIESDGVTVRITVHDGCEGDAPHAPTTYRFLGPHRFVLHTPGSVAVADPDRRESRAFVTRAFVADREHFRWAVVEALTMGIVTPLDRQPLHAGAVVRGDAALLLAGPSGTGKSTLCYAAARAGLRVLAEDTVFLQSRPTLRVWGLPGWLHLPADAGERFPELTAATPTLMANGKRKLAVDLAALDALAPGPVVERAGICLVQRGNGDPGTVTRLAGDVVVRRLTAIREEGFDAFADTIREPLSALARDGGWVLHLPADATDAVPLLEGMLREL